MDPQHRRQDHGPRLTPREHAEYQPLFDNARKLRALVNKLQDLTLEIIEADIPRSSKPGTGRPAVRKTRAKGA
jgi:hypothetical protein